MGTNRSGVQAREKRRRTRRNEIGRARFAAKQAAGAAPAAAAKSKSK